MTKRTIWVLAVMMAALVTGCTAAVTGDGGGFEATGAGGGFEIAASNRAATPVQARLTLNFIPNNPGCLVFDGGALVAFNDCEFDGTTSGNVAVDSYQSIATGAFPEGLTAVHTMVGCIDGVGCGTSVARVARIGRGVFSYDAEGTSGDLTGASMNGVMVEDFNDTPDFDFELHLVLKFR